MDENKNTEKTLDVQELFKKFLDNKKFILKVTGIGVIIGIIIAFSIPKEYTTTIVFIPETQSKSGGTMGSLAALAGINMGSLGEESLASPDLYPTFFQSTPFLRGLLNIRVEDDEQKISTTLYDYLDDHQKKPWWSYIFASPTLIKSFFLKKEEADSSKANVRFISEKELELIKSISDRIKVSSEKKTSITKIEVTMQSPKISAFLADSLTSYFQSYIIDYRTQKARNDLDYAEKLYIEAKNDYDKAQLKLASFVDGNLNVVSAKFRVIQERLQNEVNLAYSVYNQTAQQLQLAKVKVQNDTPVFTVIQPAVEPIVPSKPSKKTVFLGCVCLSFIVSIIWVFKHDIMAMIK